MKWYEIHDNFVLLCRYLVREKKYTAERLLEVVERPWRHEAEYHDARRWASQAA